MNTPHALLRWRRWLTLSLLGLCCASTTGLAQAPHRLRIVGGLAGLNQYTRHEEPFWAQELQRLSSGRYSAEIAPQDRAGIRGQEMLALLQQGVLPLGTVILNLAASTAPELGAPDLAGLNPDIAALRKTVGAFRPYLETLLRQRYGIKLLAIYTYPAQVAFCNQAFAGLRGLAGRRVRTSSATQSDFFQALGARATPTAFAEIVYNLRAGSIDCAITGTMSGYTIGLHELTTHVHGMAVNWGLSMFVAHGATWEALPDDLRALLQRELPLLEERIWAESERETGAGLDCNTGSAACGSGRPGRMSLVGTSADDERLRRELFAGTVLPRFILRCGAACAEIWNRTIGPSSGFEARAR